MFFFFLGVDFKLLWGAAGLSRARGIAGPGPVRAPKKAYLRVLAQPVVSYVRYKAITNNPYVPANNNHACQNKQASQPSSDTYISVRVRVAERHTMPAKKALLV